MGRGLTSRRRVGGLSIFVRRTAVVLVAFILCGFVGLWGHDALSSKAGRACTLGMSVGQPVRDSPGQAFGAWWAETDHQLRAMVGPVVDVRGAPGTATKADFKRQGNVWRWHFSSTRWVEVSVEHPSIATGGRGGPGWAVVGFNSCGTVHLGSGDVVR